MSKVKKVNSKVNVYHHQQKRHTAIETINLAAKHNVFMYANYQPGYLIRLILENGVNNDQQLVSELYSIYQARHSIWDDADFYMKEAVEKAIERKKRRYR